MKKVFIFMVVLFNLLCFNGFAQDSFQVYPLKAVFVSDKASESKLFLKSLSSDGSGNDRIWGSNLFIESFRGAIQNLAKNVDDKNKYSTFVAYLQIPRVSQYRINKSPKLVDLYLPITMSLNFSNMVTGESLYSYSYTYYSKYETTYDSEKNVQETEKTIVGLYRSTFRDLLNKIMSNAKENFHPFSIQAKIRKIWNDNYVLDRGNEKGIVKGDIIVDQYGNHLSVVHASSKYSVAQKMLGDPRIDSVFSKFSNESIDELKKPKVMLLSGMGERQITSVPENVIYQLFLNALGKKASFSLISINTGFYDMQKALIETTNLKQEVTQNRELPDYFLRFYFYGPFYTNVPSNKAYVTYDNYTIMACGDFLDRSGRVLYSKCVDEKITDEVFGDIRYSNEARVEVILKNSIIKLANDFIENVRFKQIELPLTKVEKTQISIEDPYNVLMPGSNLIVFHKIGRVEGVEDEVYIPTWELSVAMKNGKLALANKTLPLSSKVLEPSADDKIFINSMITHNVDNVRVLKLCKKNLENTGDYILDDFKMLSSYAIAGSIKFPFYETEDFREQIERLNDGGYGFKKKITIQEMDTKYCIEPVYKISKQTTAGNNSINTHKITIVGGLKVHDKDSIVWKKGLQQDVLISSPKNYEKQVLDFELSKYILNLLSDVTKKVEIK
jgi:hypothetical protein